MPDESLRFLLCGDFDDVEMRSVARSVGELLPSAEFRRIPGLAESEGEFRDNAGEDSSWTPDLIIVAQARPDQFSQTEVRRLQAQFPLARCVCCYGVWCESDGRNSALWPDAVRVSARTAAARIRREIDVLQGRSAPLPLTASRDEIFEFDSSGDWGRAGEGVTVRVVSPDREFKRAVEDLLESQDFAVTVDESRLELSAIVWDVDPWQESRAVELQTFRQKHPQVHIIALMNFGHPQAAAEVKACGANAVVAKLAPAEELFEALTVVFEEQDKRQEPPMNADERR